MEGFTKKHFDNLHTDDPITRYESFQYIINLTHKPVDWAYEVWDELLLQLRHKNNHQRAIAAQVLSNLAKSDPDHRMLKDIDQLMQVTKDEKFVTARHSLQSLWKVGVASKALLEIVTTRLADRFRECISEKNCTLIRYDILQVFKKMYDQLQDDRIKEKALQLIATEQDIKYHKKYAGLWK